MDLANWALQTSTRFTTGVEYQFHEGFDHFRDPEILVTLRPLEIYSIQNSNLIGSIVSEIFFLLILKVLYKNNLFILKSTLKIIIHIPKFPQKNSECFTLNPNAHEAF